MEILVEKHGNGSSPMGRAALTVSKVMGDMLALTDPVGYTLAGEDKMASGAAWVAANLPDRPHYYLDRGCVAYTLATLETLCDGWFIDVLLGGEAYLCYNAEVWYKYTPDYAG